MDIRELDRRAVESTGRFVDGLTDAELAAPTPCDRWTAADVIGHMVDNDQRLLGALAAPVERTGDPRVDFRRSSAAVAEAFADDAVMTAPYELRGRPVQARIALGVHFGDVLVHGWDIGTAIGADVRLDDDLVAAALKIISRWPDSPDIWGPDALFADRRTVAEDASPQERLLAVTGRAAAWVPA